MNISIKFLVAFSFILLTHDWVLAQTAIDSPRVKSNLEEIMEKGDVDTIYTRTTREVLIKDSFKKRTVEEEEAYQTLKRRVIKLYPYALLAKEIYRNSNETMNSMGSNKDKKKYRKVQEDALRNRFENEIKGLYTTDGPVLVKLIHRETGKTTFDILKDIKGGFKAFFYQMAAKRYGYSLKSTYDIEEDRDIESLVILLHSEGQLPVYAPN